MILRAYYCTVYLVEKNSAPLVLHVHLCGHPIHQHGRPSVSIFPVEQEQVRQLIPAEDFHLSKRENWQRMKMFGKRSPDPVYVLPCIVRVNVIKLVRS